MIVLRPATIEDVVSYVGELPNVRLRAWAGLMDGRVIGIGGLAYLPNGSVLAFINAEPEARLCAKVSIYKAAKRAIAWALDHGLREINAIKSDDIEAAERFLVKLGFRDAGRGVFVMDTDRGAEWRH